MRIETALKDSWKGENLDMDRYLKEFYEGNISVPPDILSGLCQVTLVKDEGMGKHSMMRNGKLQLVKYSLSEDRNDRNDRCVQSTNPFCNILRSESFWFFFSQGDEKPF